ncbi:hypothetical protein LCGC14_3051620 [marine sediment metagenome]|uniref:Uncharacterized protein n=1 Tax=marine sediment metagenome TaxID=412755 RepID=A0A0F8ZCE3_9ZZZZ
MFDGQHHLYEAVPSLVGGNAMVDDRFYEAAHEFLLALKYSQQWPEDLLQQARRIEERLTVEGTLEATLAEMDPLTVEGVSEEILDLVDAVDESRVRDDIEEDPEEDRFGSSDVHWRRLNPRSRKGERRRRDRQMCYS